MRPYFHPGHRPAPARPAPAPVTAAELAGAYQALYAATRPHWPGGLPTKADLTGLTKRIASRFGVPVEAVVTALSTPD